MIVNLCTCILLVCVTLSLCQTDPCTNYVQLDNVQRSTAKDLISGDIAISDDRLKDGWYRVVSLSGEDMPTEPPGTMKCGTMNPIWLNGILPVTEGTQVSHRVCVQTFSGKCEVSWNIDIRRCSGGFLVYNLVQSQSIKTAYCFGTDVPCTEGEYSETGFTPGCSADVPPETFTPIVIADLATGRVFNPSYGPSLEPVFNCSFREVTGQSYTYDVKWFINGDSVITHKRLVFSNIDQALLRPADWVNTYHLNMVVKCGVKARLNSTSVPGPMYESPFFEAGVKPDATVYQVLEGEEISIQFTSSIPVGCVGSTDIIRNHCTRTLKIAQPRYQSTPIETCTSNIKAESLVFDTQDCGLTMSVNNWRDKLYLNVTGYVDNFYNQDDRSGHIRLTTDLNSSSDLSGVWHTVIIPDVMIIVSDQDSHVTSRVCSVWNDPVFRTADGKYFHYHGIGEFVLYRNKRYPYEVHILTTRCWRPRLIRVHIFWFFWIQWVVWDPWSCICGVAIRSHDSLFVVRTCDVISTGTLYVSGRHYPSISYSVCDNKHMVINKESSTYRVTLPIGTEIVFRRNGNWIPSVSIKPSVLDIDQSEGLCGNISKTKDSSDDFIPRGSTSPTSSAQVFGNSWRVSPDSSEELFVVNPILPTEDPYLKEYCLCASEAGPADDISKFVEVHCNLTAPMVQCKNTRTPLAQSLYNVCHRERQTKRAVDNSDDIIEDTPLTYDPEYDPNYSPPDPEWKNGWNEDSARQACTDGIREMPALELCKTHAKIDEELYITSCIEDIKMAGGTEFLPYTIMNIEDVCKFEIRRNESLWTNDTTGSGGSILDQIENLLCSPNCSINGYCNKSECVCNPGYIGPDCSTILSSAPVRISVPENGLCNTKSRSCSKTNIYGDYLTDNIYCQFNHFAIKENGMEFSGKTYKTQAVYFDESKISCTFPTVDTTRKKRSTRITVEGYMITLSYDQVNYGDNVSIIIYDAQCHTCNSSTFTCDSLESCQESTNNNEEENKPELSMVLICSLIAVVIVLFGIVCGIIVFKCKLNHQRERQLNNFGQFDEYNLAVGVPPITTEFSELRRADTNLSMAWSQRSQTPTELFYANSFGDGRQKT